MIATKDIPAVVLGGGLSRRMGADKTQLLFAHSSLLEHVVTRLAPQVRNVAINVPPDHPLASSYPVISDGRPDRPGPLAGVLAALKAGHTGHPSQSHVLTLPGDTPFFPANLASRLCEAADGNRIVMASCNGRQHPIIALWPIALAADLEAWLAAPDNRRVFDFIHRHPHAIVDFPILSTPLGEIDPFFNVNTPQDLEQARAVLAGGSL